MTPCKNCHKTGSDIGYLIKAEYGWYGDKYPLYPFEYGYTIKCSKCENASEPRAMLWEAWAAWEKENGPWKPPFEQGIPDGANWFAVDEDGTGKYYDVEPVELRRCFEEAIDGISWPAGLFVNFGDWRTTKRRIERR